MGDSGLSRPRWWNRRNNPSERNPLQKKPLTAESALRYMKNNIARFRPGKFYKIKFSSFTGKTPIYRIVRLVKRKRSRLYFEGYWEYCGIIYKYAFERAVRFSNVESEGCYYVNRRIPLLPVTYANEALCRKPKWWDSCKKEVGR